MKRFLVILMVLAFALCCLAACGKNYNDAKDSDNDLAPGTDPAYESQLEVEGGTLELQTSISDGTLYVSVLMLDNPGFAGFSLNLEFDNTKCVAREIVASHLLDYEAITSNLQQGGDLSSYTSVSTMWASPSDITGDGVLFEVAFDIVDAAAEDFGLKLVCPNDAFANQNYEAVLFTVK